MDFDLHTHSFYSDGRFSPRELIQKCWELGLNVIALTDHETTKGVAEAIQAGKEYGGIKVIPAVELTSDYLDKEHHILGYFIDYRSKKLNDFLAEQRKNREERIQRVVSKLKHLGFVIEFSDVMHLVGDSVTRGHVCDVIFLQSENLALLERYGIKTRGEFVRKFLGEGGLAHVNVKRPYVKEIIDLIAEAGGISVWAHPFWQADKIEDIEKKLYQLREFGLDGLEVGYPHHNKEKTYSLHRLASEFSIIESAGSDFHQSDSKNTDKLASFETYGIEINFPFARS